MTIVNEIRNHGYISWVLNIVLLKIAGEKLSFHVLLKVIFFSENIESNFTLILPLKKFSYELLL